MRFERVAIVGSGVAGLHAAQLLMESGVEVSVFEKGQDSGGRIASCRMGEYCADIGVPMIEARSARFEQWLAAQGAQRWSPRCGDFNLATSPQKGGWVDAPGLSALSHRILDSTRNVTLYPETRVGVIWPDKQGVLLRDADGDSLGYFDAALVSTPAPEAVGLLDAVHRFQQRAERAVTEPAWVLVLELLQRPARLREFDWLEGMSKVLSRAVRDSSKPGRSGEIWVLEARSDWSRMQLNTPPEQVGRQLLEAFERLAGEPVQPLQYRVHRWIHARSQPLPGKAAALWDEQSSIGACGAWLSGGNVEGAWHSAEVLVQQMLEPDTRVA